MSLPILIRGGEVYDGGGGSPQRADVRLEGTRIAAIGPNLPTDGCDVVNASGLLVCPGLIDLHAHVCDGFGIYAVAPELAGLPTGVTTILDTGSAGCLAYESFHKYVMPAAKEDIFALLHI